MPAINRARARDIFVSFRPSVTDTEKASMASPSPRETLRMIKERMFGIPFTRRGANLAPLLIRELLYYSKTLPVLQTLPVLRPCQVVVDFFVDKSDAVVSARLSDHAKLCGEDFFSVAAI